MVSTTTKAARVKMIGTDFRGVCRTMLMTAGVLMAAPSAFAAGSSAMMTVGVTVVRSCAVDSRSAQSTGSLVVSCTTGATPGVVAGRSDSSRQRIGNGTRITIPPQQQSASGARPTTTINF